MGVWWVTFALEKHIEFLFLLIIVHKWSFNSQITKLWYLLFGEHFRVLFKNPINWMFIFFTDNSLAIVLIWVEFNFTRDLWKNMT